MKVVSLLFKLYLALIGIYILANISIAGPSAIIYFAELFLILFFVYRTRCKESVSAYAVSLIYSIISIVQPIHSSVNPSLYLDYTIRIEENALMNGSLRMEYLLFSTLSYMIFMAVMWFAMANYSKRPNVHFKKPNSISSNSRTSLLLPILIAILYSGLRYLFQSRFSILASGKSAAIPNEALFVYLIRISALFVWSYCFSKVFASSCKNAKKLLCIVALVIIIAVPQVLMGSRSEIVLLLLQFFVVLVMFYESSNNKFLTLTILLVGVLGVVSVALANYLRTHTWMNFLDFAAIRMTGIVDGIVIVKYFNTGGTPLSIARFFQHFFGIADDSLASFYTHTIIGYPSDIVHAYAIPNFASTMMYGGAVSLVILTTIESLFCALLENGIRSFLCKEKTVNNFSKVCCLVYVLVYFLFQVMMEGNIDKIIHFILVGFVVYALFFVLGKNRKPRLITYEIRERNQKIN